MTHTFLPVLTFLIGLGLGVGLGASDLLRARLGYPKQDRTHRADLIMQTIGVAMLILIGTTTYEQLHGQELRRHETECQARWNINFQDGLAARSKAAQASADSEIEFVVAQRRFALVMSHRETLPTTERDTAYIEFLAALDAKEGALAELGRARQQNPISPASGACAPN